MRMSKPLLASRSKKPTLQRLAEEVDHLRERGEDLEHLRDLKEGVQRKGDTPLIPLAKVKMDVDIDCEPHISGSTPTDSSALPS